VWAPASDLPDVDVAALDDALNALALDDGQDSAVERHDE
jgi:hypothetical protein